MEAVKLEYIEIVMGHGTVVCLSESNSTFTTLKSSELRTSESNIRERKLKAGSRSDVTGQLSISPGEGTSFLSFLTVSLWTTLNYGNKL